MTKRGRTILFSICVVLFLLLSPLLILYSEGYRLDFSSLKKGVKISQTGGVFLKVWPERADVYLDGKFKKRTSYFLDSAFIENLLPKKYKIEVKKTGFLGWQKTLKVTEKEVTEVKNIVLFPQNLNFNSISNGIKNFWFSPDQRKIILEKENDSGWSLEIYSLGINTESHLINELELTQEENQTSTEKLELVNLEFPSDSKEIYLKIQEGEALKYYKIDLEKMPITTIPTESPINPIQIENTLTFQKNNNEIYYLDKFGYVFKTDSALKESLKINQKPISIKKGVEYKLNVLEGFIFLQENQTLYQFNPDSESFEKIFDSLKDLKISPNHQKVVYFSESEIWVFFLKDNETVPTKKAGEKLFLVRLSEKIKDCYWLDNDYLIFNTTDSIKTVETDDRDQIQVWTLGNFSDSQIFFNETDKKLYLFRKENLYSSDFLVP